MTTTPPHTRRTRRARRFALPLLAFVLAFGSLAGPGVAFAARDCGDDVVDDWYGNGRVDKIYPLQCYDLALKGLPVDVVDYSSAPDDIRRALQAAIRGKLVPKKDTRDPTPGGAAPGKNGPGGKGPTTGRDGSGGSDGGVFNDVLGKAGSNDASSVPIPLLVLGSIALLLVLAGSAGYVIRRVQARRLPG